MVQFECGTSNNSPVWNTSQFLYWKLAPKKLGGGVAYGRGFKNGWVKHNKDSILRSSKKYHLPTELLAGVCWIEVGGDPNFVDSLAFGIRAIDWIGPDWIDQNLTITPPPEKTSFGAVSMQLRTAMRTLGLDPSRMGYSEMNELANCLQVDIFNIEIVAKHLLQLAEFDGFQEALPNLSMEQVRIVGARYNRGTNLSLDKIKQDMSYGDFIVRHWQELSSLVTF